MPPPPAASMVEYVTIDGFPIPCKAIDCDSLLPLWVGPDVRGSSSLIPRRSGRKPRIRRGDESKRILALTINGLWGMDDVAATDARVTLQANIDYVRANVTDPTEVGDGTRTAVLHLPTGTRTGPIIVESLDLGPKGPIAVRAALTLILPDGALA